MCTHIHSYLSAQWIPHLLQALHEAALCSLSDFPTCVVCMLEGDCVHNLHFLGPLPRYWWWGPSQCVTWLIFTKFSATITEGSLSAPIFYVFQFLSHLGLLLFWDSEEGKPNWAYAQFGLSGITAWGLLSSPHGYYC